VLLSGEESQIVSKLRDRGLAVYYEPAAVVWHCVDASRRKPRWLLRRMFWDGASQPLIDCAAGLRTRRLILRGIAYDLRQCAWWALRGLAQSIRGHKSAAWQSLLGLSQRAGRVRTQVVMIARRKSHLEKSVVFGYQGAAEES
jgi:hypothetical protein